MRARAKGIIILLLAAVFSIQTAFATTYTYDRVNRMTRVMYDDGTVSEYRTRQAGKYNQRENHNSRKPLTETVSYI